MTLPFQQRYFSYLNLEKEIPVKTRARFRQLGFVNKKLLLTHVQSNIWRHSSMFLLHLFLDCREKGLA